MMPLWIFTLGTTIFNRESLPVPYQRIASFAIGLIVPLTIGLLIQRYLPSLAKLLVRILKTCSSLLIVFIIAFAIVTNLYLFQLFTWQVSTYVTLIVFAYRSNIQVLRLFTLPLLFVAKIDICCRYGFTLDCVSSRLEYCDIIQTKTRRSCCHRN